MAKSLQLRLFMPVSSARLLSGKIEGLDCISMGPDMYDIHTTEERLSISSAKRSYEYILRVIACK